MKFAYRTLLLLLVLLLSGCVWLRVLEMKNQMKRFDEHFRIENSPQFTLHFLRPVLYDDDYLSLAKVEPSLKEALPTGARWRQVFRKIEPEGKVSPGIPIVFTLEFDREHRLKRWDFSPSFLAMVPPRFLEASLRSLGKGKVDEGKKQLKVDPEDLPKVVSPPPTRQQIVAVLGEPTEQPESEDGSLCVYRFVTDTHFVEQGFEDRRNAYAKLHFDPRTDELKKVSARFLGLKFSVDFAKLIQLEAVGKGEKEN
jgi:hypothetical protein